MQRTETKNMILCALFVGLTAVLSQIAIPIGPVPINLATFAVFCAGALLGSKLGASSLLAWALLGAVGVPVYSMFRGGLSALFGPTGGFIIGYIPAAFIIGFIIERFNKDNTFFLYPAAMFIGAVIYFSIGTIWYMFLMNISFIESFTVCCLPFIPGDLIKIAAAALLVPRLKTIVNKSA